ncbi:tryptophan synthase beta subunit-like PLP-dependent enzyme [Chytridium lagenaria]|nr:tryptophan synthase beta subunit-like PLP-dependent enzyme [Chytridium lagenaria]
MINPISIPASSFLSPSPSHNRDPISRQLSASPLPMSIGPGEFEWPDASIPTPRPWAPPPDGKDIDYLKLILTARVYDVAHETPLTYAPKLSTRLNNTIYLKREDTQPIFSFKCRGAFNRIAGNHAQGVALAALRMNMKATVVMPKFAPEIKVENVRRLGAEVVLVGADFDEAKRECERLRVERNLTFVPPYDDPYVIAGQGTIGVEIIRQLKQDRLDAIFVCCGGGGLIAGIAAFVKRVRPEVKIIGVNTTDSNSLFQSLHADSPTEIPEAGLFADGTSIKRIGTEPFRVIRSTIDDMVIVTNDEICAAIKDTFDDTRSIVEPSGALAVAGLKKFLVTNPQMNGGVFVAICSGANMNFDRLKFVAERARIGDGREAMISAIIPERPGRYSSQSFFLPRRSLLFGYILSHDFSTYLLLTTLSSPPIVYLTVHLSFLTLYSAIDPRPVVEFSYRYHDPDQAHVYFAFEVSPDGGPTEVIDVLKRLHASGIEAIDISDNELAKTHMRYLAGGRSPTVKNERLYRFRFPERPGALRKFLTRLERDWNVSLFHYRNHGADIARVLVGLQVPDDQKDAFQEFLDSLGYFYVDETSNPVYTRFLR